MGPAAGVLYKIDALTGDLGTGTIANNPAFYSTPVIDQSKVIVQTRAYWVNGPNGGVSTQFFRRSDGSYVSGVGWGTVSSKRAGASPMLCT